MLLILDKSVDLFWTFWALSIKYINTWVRVSKPWHWHFEPDSSLLWGLSCALHHVIAAPLAFTPQIPVVPPHMWQPKMLPNIVRCPLREQNHTWLRMICLNKKTGSPSSRCVGLGSLHTDPESQLFWPRNLGLGGRTSVWFRSRIQKPNDLDTSPRLPRSKLLY